MPYQLGFLTKLKALVLEGNALRAIRRDVVARGTMELKKFLRSRVDPAEAATGASAGGGGGEVAKSNGSKWATYA